MLSKVIEKLLSLNHENRLIILTSQKIGAATGLRSLLSEKGFRIIDYCDVEEFRVIFEESIKQTDEKTAVVVSMDIYIPYDIRRTFHLVELSVKSLFPNLHADTVKKYIQDWDIISFAVQLNYSEFTQVEQTEQFIHNTVFSLEMVERYCQSAVGKLWSACDGAVNYQDWISNAKSKAGIEYYAAMKNIRVDLSFADDMFRKFIADGYNRLSSEVSENTPPILTKTLSLIASRSDNKTALIVMDGMSLFDFKVLSRYFSGIEYDYGCSFALIPTTTPISRQSLLSGKYPRELSKPFALTDEEKEFKQKAESLGYSPAHVEYLRGYNAEISPISKLVAIIINEIDDISHGQRQGRSGMYNDMDLYGKNGNLQSLIRSLMEHGFSVYITSDHGNTLCTGVGGFRSGVEVESRSMRMAVLKDFAKANALLTENTTEYQGHYLNKDYRYFVCQNGASFDNKGEIVMTHGGMSIDEVIVPFVKITEVE